MSLSEDRRSDPKPRANDGAFPDGPKDAPSAGDDAYLAARITEVLQPELEGQENLPEIVEEILNITAEAYSGPLPHPSHLAAFEQIEKGTAHRILLMAESQQSHRHWQERMRTIYPYSGLLLGFLCFLACLIAAVSLAPTAPYVAALCLGLPVVGAVGWFVKARLSRDE